MELESSQLSGNATIPLQQWQTRIHFVILQDVMPSICWGGVKYSEQQGMQRERAREKKVSTRYLPELHKSTCPLSHSSILQPRQVIDHKLYVYLNRPAMYIGLLCWLSCWAIDWFWWLFYLWLWKSIIHQRKWDHKEKSSGTHGWSKAPSGANTAICYHGGGKATHTHTVGVKGE